VPETRLDPLGRLGRLHDQPRPPTRRRGRRNPAEQVEPPGDEPADDGLGRSRGGLSMKIHLVGEQGRGSLAALITAGQRGDSPQFIAVLDALRVPRLGPGRPRTRPDRVLADKA
jgi:hypothetical protein